MSSPAQSPRVTDDVDPDAPTPDENDNEQPTAEGDPTMNRGDEIPGYDFEVKEQDRWLPIANVARIMKTALPENAKIAKEAKECMQECVSEFISFITSEASEKCQQEKRKTVNGEDILFAMTSLGFENYGEALKIYLARYREVSKLGPVEDSTANISTSHYYPDPHKNLVARGEHQRPNVASSSGTGANSTTSPGYETTNHNVLSNPMDPSVEGGTDFAYGHPGPDQY